MAPPATGDDCVSFLQWCLPRLGLRWGGFRKVRSTVCKRLRRRLCDLGLSGFDDYRRRLEAEGEEWAHLEAACRIPISRFYRDRRVFEVLGEQVLPLLAATAANARVRCWSAGCASGEEPYSLALIWTHMVQPRFPGVALSILATDADEEMIRRGSAACYSASSLTDLPRNWVGEAFVPQRARFCLREPWRAMVRFECQDVRRTMPAGRFDLVLCRNMAFTYFCPGDQEKTRARLLDSLRPGGFLVVGRHERLAAMAPWRPNLPIYRGGAPPSA